MAVWGDLTNSWEKKWKAKGKKKDIPIEWRVPKNSRSDKKGLLSDQCNETEEKNRMGKTSDLFKKIRDTEEILHAKKGTIMHRNCMDLTEAEAIKNRWQENTEELYKKDLHDPDNHNGVIIHLESDILECEVKWDLGSIIMKKLVEVMEFQLSYFKS